MCPIESMGRSQRRNERGKTNLEGFNPQKPMTTWSGKSSNGWFLQVVACTEYISGVAVNLVLIFIGGYNNSWGSTGVCENKLTVRVELSFYLVY